MTGALAAEIEPDLHRVPVALDDRSYDILIGAGLIGRAGALIKPVLPGNRVIVVTDETVAGLHLETLKASLTTAGLDHTALILPPGEGTKSFDHYAGLMNELLALGLERKTTILAFGGGVIGDLAGFAAATALRGIPFVQIPTTLLAQVDSSVGGKTAINAPAGKNLVGAFYQPRMVLADTGILDSLPRRQLLAGYAEVVKYGALGDLPFFEWLEQHGPALIDGDGNARAEAVARSCAAKAAIVAQDEREGGLRALLNLGHTFGHALESRLGYGPDLLHGEAVAMGMAMAFSLSVKMGLCSGQDADRLNRHMAATGLRLKPTAISGVQWDVDDLIKRMFKDKKVEAGRITFILARGLGDAFITADVGEADLRATLEEALAD